MVLMNILLEQKAKVSKDLCTNSQFSTEPYKPERFTMKFSIMSVLPAGLVIFRSTSMVLHAKSAPVNVQIQVVYVILVKLYVMTGSAVNVQASL